MFVENAYPNDTRVRNEAEALNRGGLFSDCRWPCARRARLRSEVVNGVQVIPPAPSGTIPENAGRRIRPLPTSFIKGQVTARLRK